MYSDLCVCGAALAFEKIEPLSFFQASMQCLNVLHQKEMVYLNACLGFTVVNQTP